VGQARPTTLAGLLSDTAASVPDRFALGSTAGARLTYAELAECVARVGAALRSAGARRADRVGTLLPGGPEAAKAFLGIASHAVCAPLNPASAPAELERSLSQLGLRLLVTGDGPDSPAAQVARKLGVLVVDVAELNGEGTPADAFTEPHVDDVALLLCTSGTTSRPKLVPLTHANLCASATSVAGTLRLTSVDLCLNPMPLFHVHGLVAGLLASLAAGAGVVCTPRFDPTRTLAWLAELRPTWYTAVPTMHQALLSAGERAPGLRPIATSLRLIRSSSAPLSPTVLGGLERVFGVPVIEAYGMTEAAHQIASNPLPPEVRKPGTVGRPAGPEVAIVDGEIVIRGANVTAGYADNPGANDEAFTEDGWFRTGDEGRIDDEGYLTIVGRRKEFINRGGEKISPVEVDEALAQHADVEHAVAFAIPHPTLGEEIGAGVVLRPHAKTAVRELRTHAASLLAPSKVPRRIVLLEELPTGPSGKVQRLGLAGTLGVTSAPGAGRSPRTPLESALAELWAQVLQLQQVGVDEDFFLLGGDSLVAAELQAAVAETFGVEVPLESLVGEASTVADMAALLERRREPAPVALSERLFRVQPLGSRPPLVFVDPSLALMHCLLPRLGPDQPVLGVLMAPVDENPTAFDSIEAIAEFHLRTLLEACPTGPYLLAGHSFLGVVAFELARRLQTRGDTVRLLLLLDSVCPTARWAAGPLAAASRPAGDRNLLASRYVPAELDAPTVLLYTRGSAEETGTTHLGWQGVIGRLELQEVDGDHSSMLREPRVRRLAETVASCLEAAQGRP
jgi:oxalate---CoA ligase